MKKGFVVLGIPVVVAALMVLLVTVASAASSAPAQRVTLSKTASNPAPRVGEIFTFTLNFNTTAVETQTLQVMVIDRNPNSAYLRIITGSLTGGATYSPTIDGVVWQGTLEPFAAQPQEVAFQMQVMSMPAAALATGFVVTNTVIMNDVMSPGTLPEVRAEYPIRIMPLRILLPIIFRNAAAR